MKKLLICIFCLMMAFSTACAEKTASTPSESQNETTETTPNTPAENKLGLQEENPLTNSLFNYGLVAVKVGDKWGFINLQGEMIIAPQFDDCGKFRQGLYTVSDNGTYYFINTKGEAVSEPKSGIASYFTEGYCAIINYETDENGNVVGWKNMSFINQSGEVSFSLPEKTECWPIRDGLILARSENSISVYNSNGVKLFELEGAHLFEGDESTYRVFFDDLMCVELNGKWGAVNIEGQWVIEPKFDRLGCFENGVALAKTGDLYGYIDTTGAWVVEPQFIDNYEHFSEGLVGVETADQFGYIDAQGNWQIILEDFEWVVFGEFNEGFAYVTTDQGAGLINKTGDWVVQPGYEHISNVKFGLAAVETSFRHYGYMNTSGELVISDEYRYATAFFDDGYAIAQKNDGKWVIIDANCNVILDGGFDGIGNYWTSYNEDGSVSGTGRVG